MTKSIYLIGIISYIFWPLSVSSQGLVENDSTLALAVYYGNYAMAEKMLNDRVVSDSATGNGLFGILCTAVNHDDTLMVKLLLDHGANMYDTTGALPIGEVAAISDASHALAILHARGYPFTIRAKITHESLIETAVRHNAYQTVKYLLNKGFSPNEADSFGISLLITAVWVTGDTTMVSLLLHAGADPNYQDSKSFYPIYGAINTLENLPHFLFRYSDGTVIKDSSGFTTRQNTQRRVIEFLLQGGANPNVEDHPGGSPLSYAVKSCDIETVKLLLKYGANPKLL